MSVRFGERNPACGICLREGMLGDGGGKESRVIERNSNSYLMER